jgi:hypothetical protein
VANDLVISSGNQPSARNQYVPRQIGDREQQIVRDILREFGQYQLERGVFAGQWEEAALLLLPTSRNTFFYGNFNWPGAKKTAQQVDATGALALHRFCAIADSLVTPRGTQWHGLQGDEYVMKDRASRLWFEQTTADLFRLRYAAAANFAAQNYNNWQSLGAFGNATMYIDKADNRWFRGNRGFRYKAIPFGETFFGENHQGRVDKMYRWFKLTARQAVQKWGRAALPPNLIAPLIQESQWPYNFLHVVKPRDDFDPERLDVKALPFCSYYVSLEGRCLMAPEGGYRVFPFAVSRYDQTPQEVYGRGPAHIVLPSMKTKNAMKVTNLKQAHRNADPVLLLAEDGLTGMDLRPGAMNPGGMSSDGKPLVGVLPAGNYQISKEAMAEEGAIIDDVFLVSLFKVLTEHPDMTATQVIELVNEKGMLVAPTLGRQHTEYVGGMVPRELDLMSEMQMLRQMPPRLLEAVRAQGHGAYEVTDTSPLAEAAKTSKVVGFNRTTENLRELVNITGDQSLLDPIDFDVAIRDIAQINGVPEKWMADDQAIAQKRKARAQAMAQQQKNEAAPGQAALMNAAAKQAKSGLPTQQQLPAIQGGGP